MVIESEGIKMEKEKVKRVLEWPTPKYVKDIQKFLGLANYYCWFIEGFTTVARPLHDLVKKDKKWEWTEREEKAFIVMECFKPNILFFFYLFFFWFYISFSFSFRTMKKTHDKQVT